MTSRYASYFRNDPKAFIPDDELPAKARKMAAIMVSRALMESKSVIVRDKCHGLTGANLSYRLRMTRIINRKIVASWGYVLCR